MSKQASLFSFFSPKGGVTPKSTQSSNVVSKTTPSTKNVPSTPKSSRGPLKRLNSKIKTKEVEEEEDNGEIEENTPKRRKVIISSSESEAESEGDDEYKPDKNGYDDDIEEEYEDDDGDEEDESSMKITKKKSGKNGLKTSKKTSQEDVEMKYEEDDTKAVSDDGEFTFDPAMATSFIGSFGMRDEDISKKVEEIMENEINVDIEDINTEDEEKSKKKNKTKVDNDDDGVLEYVHETLDFLKPDKIRDGNGRHRDHPDYDPTTLKISDSFIQEQTPGHQQWWQLKAANFDTVLLFKVGKFYELYHMDATVAVNCLNLAYMKGKFAHCGFPETAYGRFADQLVQRGYKVARVEQTETPDQLAERQKKMAGKKIKVVRRELCRVTTVGTRTYDAMETPYEESKGDEGEGGGGGTIGESSTAYLLAIKENINRNDHGTLVTTFGVAFIDTSIGRFHIGSFNDDCYFSHLRTLIARHPPVQILIERGKLSSSTRSVLSSMLPSNVPIDSLTPNKEFLEPEKTITLLLDRSRLGSDSSEWPDTLKSMLSLNGGIPCTSNEYKEAWSALGALISFLRRCLIDVDMVTMKQFERFDPTSTPSKLDSSSSSSSTIWNNRRMVIDGVGLEQLSLIPLDYASEQTSGSLYSILNRCKTPFGARLLRSWVCAPTCDKEIIEERQKALEWILTSDGIKCTAKLEDLLESLPDLERLLQKIHSIGLIHRATEHPDSRAIMFEGDKYAKRRIRDLILALEGFKTCQQIGEWCDECRGDDKRGQSLLSSTPFNVKKDLIYFENAFDGENAEKTGKIIPNEGTDENYDAARNRVVQVKKQIEEYRKNISGKLGCTATLINMGKDKNLLELPDKISVPNSFEQRTRRKGFVRYTSLELGRLNSELLEAESDVECLLKDATRRMFEEFDKRKKKWQGALEALSTLDVLISMAKYAQSTGVEMCTPMFVYDNEKPILEIVEGYHPCIVVTGLASLLDEGVDNCSTTFIPNDITLGGTAPSTLLLTGPNMGGKSTLMRQIAVLTVLAHMGSLVPAKSMKLSPVDRIFTRVGASDRLVSGQSTFFVEMNESSIALRDATKHSLAIFDELGRGTGTLDGQSLAWAIMDEMTHRIGGRSVFSTHYHGLCERLENDKGVLQMHMGCVVEEDDECATPSQEAVTFLYRLMPGVCPRSFGFNAARLAGIDEHVIGESWKAARRTFGDVNALKKLREGALNDDTSIDDLRKMVELCF